MEPVGRITNLQRRNGRYYIRVRVPDELRGQLKKLEIVEALKTSDRSTAHIRLLDRRAEIFREFEIRRRSASAAIAKIETVESLRDLTLSWLEEQDKLQDRYARQVLDGTAAIDTEDYLDVLRDDAAGCVQDDAGVQQQIKNILKHARVEIEPGSLLQGRLFDWVRTGLVNLFERQIARISGAQSLPNLRPEDLRQLTAIDRAEDARELLPSRRARGITIAELIADYSSDPARAGNSPKTVADYAVIFRTLTEVLGPKRQVRDITRQDCVQVRELLLALPVHATKRNPGLTLSQIAEQFRGQRDVTRLSTVTVNSHLGALASLFRWAVKEQHIPRNPAEGLKVAATPDRYRDPRDRFDAEELQAIFKAPIYTGCVDDEENYAKVGDNHPRRGRFWVPLLSLFLGMRLNECCQLDTKDITTIDGFQVVNITASADGRKRLKTKFSTRQVPVHPDLIRLGFQEFVEAQRERRAERLFPELPLGKSGYHSDPFSKWFGRFLNSVGITRPNVGFHSFRHGFRDALRRANVSEERVCALGGWSQGTNAHTGYGRGFSVRDLAAEVGKISFPALNLEHLVPRSGVQPVATRALDLGSNQSTGDRT
jgi:integrase